MATQVLAWRRLRAAHERCVCRCALAGSQLGRVQLRLARRPVGRPAGDKAVPYRLGQTLLYRRAAAGTSIFSMSDVMNCARVCRLSTISAHERI